MLTAIPCTIMRGGTSRGIYFHAKDLPADVATRIIQMIEDDTRAPNGARLAAPSWDLR